MSEAKTPVVLDLASLPREQVGPFILLGLEKDATAAEIQASWAQRVLWARKKQISIPLEDINWAREVINDPERRVKADAGSFNPDTADGTLRRLAEWFGASGVGMPTWRPRDAETPPTEFVPGVDVPEPAEVRQSLTIPPVPQDLPTVHRILDQLVLEPLDPWSLSLSSDPTKDHAP